MALINVFCLLGAATSYVLAWYGLPTVEGLSQTLALGGPLAFVGYAVSKGFDHASANKYGRVVDVNASSSSYDYSGDGDGTSGD
jgi:hypothetical protein